jgi:molybdopterin/thiamine biosynthesis adenylyltransferase
MQKYSRQIAYWGKDGQAKIESACVLIAGVGGLGSILSQVLVRAGIGKLILIDDGIIDLPDLNRQTLYFEEDLNKYKVDVAKERLLQINPNIEIIINSENIDESFNISENEIIIADCLDNFKSRIFLYNNLPDDIFYVHGGVDAETGQVISLKKGFSSDFKDIFAGVVDLDKLIPVTPDAVFLIASVMAREIFNIILGKPALLNKFWIISFIDFYVSFLEI